MRDYVDGKKELSNLYLSAKVAVSLNITHSACATGIG